MSKKLIIQIPCYNEAQTLALALKEIPRQIPGFDQVELLVIDDGSCDNTAEIARQCGVEHVVVHPANWGLAKAFMSGLNAALKAGADVIVNTDADNQYNAADIPLLTAPILSGEAEYVIGTRPIAEIPHFSPVKKLLQKFGSYMVRKFSGTQVEDAPSGFRAISRDAALQLNVFNNYTYTLETIIQAGVKNIPIVCVPIRVNEDLRPSRLVKSIPKYIQRSIFTMFRIAIVYRPFRFFFSVSVILTLLGLIPCVRFMVHYLQYGSGGMIQSLILGAILLLMAGLTFMLALVADLLAVNRALLEDIQYRQRKNSSVEKNK